MNLDTAMANDKEAADRDTARRRLRLFAAVLAALAAGFCVTAMVSSEPLHAYLTLLTGALPDIHWSDAQGWQIRRMVRFGQVVENAITLTFLGLAVAIPFRARIFSLGADGQMFLGALASAAVSLYLPLPWFCVLPLAFCAALAVGFAWGALPGWLKVRFGANEIVTTLMLNLIAVELYRLLVSTAMRDPNAGFLATPIFPDAAILTAILPRTNVSAMLFVALAAAAGAALLMTRSVAGYEIRAIGSDTAFARRAGMPVERAVILATAFGGAFAALAGVHIGNALLKRLPVDLSPGIGLDGLVIALLARNDPKAVPIAAFFYAYLTVGAQAMERSNDVPREIALVIQAFIILFVVARQLPLPAIRLPWRQLPPAAEETP